jgi:hypothetical protein
MSNFVSIKWDRFIAQQHNLSEITRADKEGVKLPSGQEQLSKYVANPPTHYIQFSDINKLGINPSTAFKTPVGIYSYPLSTDLFIQFVQGKLPFAQERQYVIVFKPKNISKIIINMNEAHATDHNKSGVSLKEFWQYMKQLLDMDSDFAKRVRKESSEESEANRRRNPYLIKRYEKVGLTPIPNDIRHVIFSNTFWDALNMTAKDSRYTAGYLWRLTQIASDYDPHTWRTTLVDLGIEGWADLNEAGVVHDAEPTQGVFFSADYIKMTEILRNPTKGTTVKIRNLYLPIFKAAKSLIPDVLKETGLDKLLSAQEVEASISPGAKQDPQGGVGAYFWSKLMSTWGVAEAGSIPDDGVQLIKDLRNNEPWAEEELKTALFGYIAHRWFQDGSVFLRVLFKDPNMENRERDKSTKLKRAGWALRELMLPRSSAARPIVRTGGVRGEFHSSTTEFYNFSKIKTALGEWIADAEEAKNNPPEPGMTQFWQAKRWGRGLESGPWYIGAPTGRKVGDMGRKLIQMYGGQNSFWGESAEDWAYAEETGGESRPAEANETPT